MTPRYQEEQLLDQLRRDATVIARAFGLVFRSIRQTRKDARLYGVCDTEGNIRLRLRSRSSGSFLRYPSLIATLCHELAHLRHFDHGAEFVAFYRQLLEFARTTGLYQPASAAVLRAAQGPRSGAVRLDRAASAPSRSHGRRGSSGGRTKQGASATRTKARSGSNAVRPRQLRLPID